MQNYDPELDRQQFEAEMKEYAAANEKNGIDQMQRLGFKKTSAVPA